MREKSVERFLNCAREAKRRKDENNFLKCVARTLKIPEDQARDIFHTAIINAMPKTKEEVEKLRAKHQPEEGE